MKLITYSLYGEDPQYSEGAIQNARLLPDVYPGWKARFYVSQEISTAVIKELRALGSEVEVR